MKCETHDCDLIIDCRRCGAPNCCPKCCEEATGELIEHCRSVFFEEIRELCEKATPGPWRVRPLKHDDYGVIRAADDMPVASAGMGCRMPDDWRGRPDAPPEVEANSQFIAASRTAIPELLAHVEALEKKLQDRQECINRMRDTIHELESRP